MHLCMNAVPEEARKPWSARLKVKMSHPLWHGDLKPSLQLLYHFSLYFKPGSLTDPGTR